VQNYESCLYIDPNFVVWGRKLYIGVGTANRNDADGCCTTTTAVGLLRRCQLRKGLCGLSFNLNMLWKNV